MQSHMGEKPYLKCYYQHCFVMMSIVFIEWANGLVNVEKAHKKSLCHYSYIITGEKPYMCLLIPVKLSVYSYWWYLWSIICEIKIGSTPNTKNYKYWNNGSIPWVAISDLNNNIIFDTKKLKINMKH